MHFANSSILCVDGIPESCDLIRLLLDDSDCRYSINAVENAAAACDVLKDEPVDLCILDYALPDLTGVQFCKYLRQNGFTAPIVFFSAMARTIDREKAIAAGADDYLVKPDDLDIFPAAIAHLLAIHPAAFEIRSEYQNYRRPLHFSSPFEYVLLPTYA